MRRLIYSRKSGVDNESFIFTVKTDNTGTSSPTQFTIPTTGTGYNYTVKTSDSQTIAGNTGNLTIAFPSAGTYDVKITGDFPRIFFNNGGDRLKLLEVKQWGTITWTSFSAAFSGCSNVIFSNIQDVPRLSPGVSARFGFAFRFCSSLTTIGRLNEWDMSKTNTIDYMFQNCPNFNQNVGGWNTSNITNFSYAFGNCGVFNNGGSPDINNWNTSSATTLAALFQNCLNFNQPVGNWNTSNVTDMGSTFYGCTPFNQNLSSWNTSKVTNFSSMFYLDVNYNNLGDSGINNWDVSKCINFNSMFLNAYKFNQPLGNWNFSTISNFTLSSTLSGTREFDQNLSSWNLNRCTTLNSTFASCLVFNNGGDAGINNWDVQNVTSLSGTFIDNRLFNQPLNSWNTAKVTDMNNTFNGCWVFNQPLNLWNTSLVTGMGGMFRYARAFNQNIGAWNVTKNRNFAYFTQSIPAGVFNNGGSPDINNWILNPTQTISMSHMFSGVSFNQPIGSWNTSMVTDMTFMFSSSGFNQYIGGWNTGNVTLMGGMFYDSNSFNQDVGGWDVSKVTSFAGTFRNNPFNQNLSLWNVGNATDMSQMFLSAPFNNGGDPGIGNWDVRKVVNVTAMFINSSALTQDISDWQFLELTTATNFRNGATTVSLPTVQLDAIYNKWTNNLLKPSVTISFGTAKRSAAGTEARALLTRVNSTKAITNAVNNGSGLIRISATAHGLTTGNKCFISGVVGTTEANGPWIVTVVDANTIDLDGSTFTNAYTSGGTLRTGYGWTITDGGI
jgi:surface protein